MKIANPEFTETDARSRLRLAPDDAAANYLLGALLLSKNELANSEDFLRRSIETKPTATACNDLAENLRLQKRLPEAETFVRQALKLQPDLPPALDTLALVLCDAGQCEEAAQAAKQAVTAKPEHPTYQLTLLRAQIGLGDKEGVRQRLEWFSQTDYAIPKELQDQIEAMR
ncbi:MAG TPA: tetratricopeptide repeat protein [Kiritimatiellia bacterium]|nr:tetratricopeptide repeat protein [Kiritimatiellia bacterium]HRU71676.1 tetratricopeptide repeat protein [Kiritimatiellia bacterium]